MSRIRPTFRPSRKPTQRSDPWAAWMTSGQAAVASPVERAFAPDGRRDCRPGQRRRADFWRPVCGDQATDRRQLPDRLQGRPSLCTTVEGVAILASASMRSAYRSNHRDFAPCHHWLRRHTRVRADRAGSRGLARAAAGHGSRCMGGGPGLRGGDHASDRSSASRAGHPAGLRCGSGAVRRGVARGRAGSCPGCGGGTGRHQPRHRRRRHSGRHPDPNRSRKPCPSHRRRHT